MSRKVWVFATVSVLVVVASTLLVELRETAAASTLSVGTRGWLASRLYLERRGVDVTLLDRPLHESPPSGVLVLAFPWQHSVRQDELDAIRRMLLQGATIVFAYSGDVDARGETAVAERLALEWKTLRERPPLGFLSWRRFVSEEWTLRGVGAAPPLTVSAFTRAPRAPDKADIWYRSPQAEPVVFMIHSGTGRIVVLPSETFANARVANLGNADLLETLSAFIGHDWLFDEFHHGLAAPKSPEEQQPQVAFDLLLAHLALVYLLVVWRLSKRFGPVRQERAMLRGSTRSFLVGLGTLHDRLGHYREAGPLLVSRAGALQPQIDLAIPTDVGTATDLVGLARDVAERQSTRATRRTTET